MAAPLVSIILRSFNEGWALRETLSALRGQDYLNWELIVIDSGSTDGSVELIRAARPRHFLQIAPHEYNPARVMNRGMELARSAFGIFLNADATPQGNNWLRPLAEALFDPRVAAVFGKQIPRPDCAAVFAHDYARCFGENRESKNWDHFFSMASSGIRKDVWAGRGFDERMQYSEDDEWTRWARAQGYKIVYAPESVVMHSHNYTPAQAWKRSFGEARALAAVWPGRRADFNWPRIVLLGWLNDARRDLIFCAQKKRLREWPHALRIRWNQRRGKLAGFHAGWEFYRGNTHALHASDHAARSERRADAGAPRFTLDGDDELENFLACLCETLSGEVQKIVPPGQLEALVLGGGYGRGEGGVLRTPAGERPYNDLEFYVFLCGNRFWNERKFSGVLNALGERLSPEAGLHVEFKVDSIARWRRAPVTMFSYDLVSGHRVIGLGGRHENNATFNLQRPTPEGSRTDASWEVGTGMLNGEHSRVFSGCEHHLDAGAIPLHEATRLLLNRCSGLLLAREKLKRENFTAADADFVQRNMAKAQLAFGDAVLTAFGQYHWSCRERQARLQRLAWPDAPPWLEEARRHHATGVEFKLHPFYTPLARAALQSRLEEIIAFALPVWLWLEGRRLGRRFASARDYALAQADQCPDAHPWRNRLLNLKALGWAAALDRPGWRHPRERIFNALALLLWESPARDEQTRDCIRRQLRPWRDAPADLVRVYQTCWQRLG